MDHIGPGWKPSGLQDGALFRGGTHALRRHRLRSDAVRYSVLLPAGPGSGRGATGRAAIVGSLLGSPAVGVLLILAGLGFLASTSFVLVAADKVGHLKRVYLAADLPPGRIIALPGEKGPQAEILGPGFHFRPLLNVLYDVEERDVVQIPEGYYGQITTLDGAPMPEGMSSPP